MLRRPLAIPRHTLYVSYVPQIVMAHTRHTGRAAWLWYHMVTFRVQRFQQAQARRRWQRSQQLQLLAVAVAFGLVPAPRQSSRFVTWLGWLCTSEREAARQEWRAVRQQSRRAQWPRRYQ